MAKYTKQEIEEKLKSCYDEVAASALNWRTFLEKSAEFYKYGFSDKLLILNMRPDATACASFDIWTKTLNKRITYKSNGIPLLHNGRLDYVFDVSDTSAKKVNLWRITDENKLQATTAITNGFNSSSKDLKEALKNEVIKNFERREEAFRAEFEQLIAEQVIPANTFDNYKNFIINSSLYSIFGRCNVDFNRADFDFSNLNMFKNHKALAFIGKSISVISSDILRQVERNVKAVNLMLNQQKTNNITLTNTALDGQRNEQLTLNIINNPDIIQPPVDMPYPKFDIPMVDTMGKIQTLTEFNKDIKNLENNTPYKIIFSDGTVFNGSVNSTKDFREHINLQPLNKENIAEFNLYTKEIDPNLFLFKQIEEQVVFMFYDTEKLGYVYNYIDNILIKQATENKNSVAFFDYLKNNSKQRLIDIYDKDFAKADELFNNGENLFTGLTDETMKGLISLSEPEPSNIIGNTVYRYIKDKTYRKLDNELARAVIADIENTDIKFSGKINNDNTITLTFGKIDINEVDKLIREHKTTEKPEKEHNASFSKEQIEIARKTNLVDFLMSRGIQLKRVGTNEYTLPEHDSMRISNDKGFYWNSRSIGGNALDFCINYYGMDFQTAVKDLLSYNGYTLDNTEHTYTAPPVSQQPKTKEEHNTIPIPNGLADKSNRTYAYLTKTRKISSDTVQKLIKDGIVAQDNNGNAVFKIYNENGELSGAEISGTLTDKRFKQLTENQANGFTITQNNGSNAPTLYFFEAAIDTISFYDIYKDIIPDFVAISMAGLKNAVIEKEISKYEAKYGVKPNIEICSDNDEAGTKFADKIINKLSEQGYEINRFNMFDNILDFTAYKNKGIKDWNDLLVNITTDNFIIKASLKDILEEQPNTNKLNNAFQQLIDNHSFSNQTITLLNRVKNQMNVNNIPKFDLSTLELPIFQQTYGSLSRINENFFNGKLKEIIAEINSYMNISDSEISKENEIPKASQNIIDLSSYAEAVVYCHWSESEAFKENKVYTLAEFDKLMSEEDLKVSKLKKEYEERNDYYPYFKTKFTLHLPDGTEHTDRQDIGDSFGGIINYLSNYDKFDKEVLEAYKNSSNLDKENTDYYLVENTNGSLTLNAWDNKNDIMKEYTISKEVVKEANEKYISPDLFIEFIINNSKFNSISKADVGDEGYNSFVSFYENIYNSKALLSKGLTNDTKNACYNYFFREPIINEISEVSNTDILELNNTNTEVIENNSEEITEKPATLNVGDIIRLDNENWKITSTDFIMEFENTDKNSYNQAFSYIGGVESFIDTHDFVLGQQENVKAIDNAYNKNKSTKNFKITDPDLGKGTPKQKYERNVTAIKLLKQLENENRTANAEEQEILSQYVGWGGLSEAFDERKWKNEYNELKELLTDDEFKAAEASTLNAHYTSPEIISEMYNAIKNLGFEKGKILEPAMGVGNFLGLAPEDIQAKFYGVELDSISGRIAKQLYPEANIQIKGFEKTNYNSNSFDIAIGNVPFGEYGVYDPDFKENGFLIHDYFFAKALDKVKPKGVIAFITSKGTLDKKDSRVRKYLAERADLLGAVRLPNTAFKANAGTEVTSDIIFLQKREAPRDLSLDTPEWISTSTDKNGIEINNYFVNNPSMICGEMTMVSGPYGMTATCKPFENISLKESLHNSLSQIKGEIIEADIDLPVQQTNELSNIDEDSFRNFTYNLIGDDIYYKSINGLEKQEIKGSTKERMKGLIEISSTLQQLISAQRDNAEDSIIKELQDALNTQYDSFTAKFGLISALNNKRLFKDDDTYMLMSSLENINDKGELESKADIFTKRTVMPYKAVEHVNTADEALTVSIAEKAKVDLDYMSRLSDRSISELVNDLEGVIFENPVTKEFETNDEYLSGNVRKKLEIARKAVKEDSKYKINVSSLEAVQPEDLKPSEITVQLGSTWVPEKIYQQFVYELLDTPFRCQQNNYRYNGNPFEAGGNNTTIALSYSEYDSTFGISNKNSIAADKTNIKATTTYGTSRVNAYEIIEDTLNLKPVKVFDYIEVDGKKKAVLNDKETLLAQEKQDLIKSKFKKWIFDDAQRADTLCKIYNEKFNSIRPREFDGSHITFGGINPEIKLREHQVNAIAHSLYGGNTLFAHSVGAGKTFEMVASAMESKRLGLCTKSMIAVPKHIVNQFAKEFLQLYPTANILVPDEKDFSKENRQKFCSRIAMGNYDAIILSHNQFEKIPLSDERQIKFIENEIADIQSAILSMAGEKDKGFTVKQLNKQAKKLQERLEKLNNNKRRDRTITFEDMGIDKLFVDEAHLFKNLYFNTKMGRNVAGINASSVSQRAEDLYMKCRYLDEKTGGKGIVFATGTPISNSMTELYTMQRYLQYNELKERGLNHFDAWASCFGETKLSLELAPEGTGYQMKTRFSNFFNLPELMSTFRTMADVKTPEVLNLPVPKANYHNIVTEPSAYQKEMVQGLADRANDIRQHKVDNTIDNMLKVTNDGRTLALDQRLANELLPDDENSKVNICVKNVFNIWQNTTEEKSTQMIFCDLSTPHYDGKFNVYDDIKNKLMEKGIPSDEIAFIHDCKTDVQKQELFAKVRNGDVRVLLGSTGKMGTGTNCQQKLKALHHLDTPYRPSDLEQRNGRIIRQGNTNPEVDIFSYVTKGTFDSYLYQLVENKQRFISQIMTNKSPARAAEDVDEATLNYAQIKALASDNPKIKEKMDLEIEVNKLRLVFASYQENKRNLQHNITKTFPEKISKLKANIEGYKKDIAELNKLENNDFSITLDNIAYTDKKEAGKALLEARKLIRPDSEEAIKIGSFKGYDLSLSFDRIFNKFTVQLNKNMTYTFELGSDELGNLTRMTNAIKTAEAFLKQNETKLEETNNNLKTAKEEFEKPFEALEELESKEARLSELNKEFAENTVEKENKVKTKEQELEI